MTEALSLPLSAACGLLLVLLVRRPRTVTAAALGVGAGAADADAARIPLSDRGGSASRAWAWSSGTGGSGWRWPRPARSPAPSIAPWSARNERQFGTPAPTSGYAGFILAQRMAYEAMTPREWAAEWLYALPGFGPAAARAVFPDAVGRLGWQDRPDTFYMVGNTSMPCRSWPPTRPTRRTRSASCLRRYVWPHPFRFAAVTLVMAWKSLWVRKYFSLVAAPFLAVMLWRALRRRDGVRLAFVLPPLFVVALHAATTVATPRYTLMLVPAYAVAFGLAAGPWLTRRAGALLRRPVRA